MGLLAVALVGAGLVLGTTEAYSKPPEDPAAHRAPERGVGPPPEKATVDLVLKLAEASKTRDVFLKAAKTYYPAFFSVDNSLLNFDSKTNCGKRGAVTPERPGPISMDPESRMTFRFFDTNVEGCNNVVEGFQQTNDPKVPYEFFQAIWFPDGSVYTEKNPVSCTQCHGVPPVPIFATGLAVINGRLFPGAGDGVTWPGFYGQTNGEIAPGSESAEGFSRFLAGAGVKGSPYQLYGYGTGVKTIQDLDRIRSQAATLLIDTSTVYQVPMIRALEDTADHVLAGAMALSLQPEGTFRADATVLPQSIPGIPSACLTCHTGASPSGGYIAFDNRSQLIKLLQAKNDGAFLKTVLDRVGHKVPQRRMPPDPESNLSPAQINLLKSTLETLMKIK